jgi:hypothetical protein
MKHQVFGYNYDNPAKPVAISAFIEAAEYEAVRKSQDICCLVLLFEERFQLALDNFHEWETELLEQAQSALLWNTNDFSTAMQQRLKLDRRFVNLLSSLRLYLDQSDHNISQICGKESRELKEIKEFKNSLYDNHFGFRLLEALRNHVQHSSLPLNTISYGSRRVESKDGFYVQFSVAPKISWEELSENEKFTKRVLEELKDKTDYFDLRLAAREYIDCLTLLHAQIRGTLREHFSNSRAIYEMAIERHSKIGGHKVKHIRMDALEDDGRSLGRVELVDEFLKLHDALRAKNSKVLDIRRSFASNALHKS